MISKSGFLPYFSGKSGKKAKKVSLEVKEQSESIKPLDILPVSSRGSGLPQYYLVLDKEGKNFLGLPLKIDPEKRRADESIFAYNDPNPERIIETVPVNKIVNSNFYRYKMRIN